MVWFPCGWLQAMFYRASSFNGDLSRWDVGKVTTIMQVRVLQPCAKLRGRGTWMGEVDGWVQERGEMLMFVHLA